jgi:hypothetical protein
MSVANTGVGELPMTGFERGTGVADDIVIHK